MREKQQIVKDAAKRYLAGKSIEELAKEYDMNAANLHKVLYAAHSGPKWQVEFQSKVLNIHEVIEIEVPPLLPDETIRAIRAKAEANPDLHAWSHQTPLFVFANDSVSALRVCHVWPDQSQWTAILSARAPHTRPPVSGRTNQVMDSSSRDRGRRNAPFVSETFGNPSAVQRAMEEATPNNEKVQEAVKRLESVTKELSKKLESSRQRILALIA